MLRHICCRMNKPFTIAIILAYLCSLARGVSLVLEDRDGNSVMSTSVDTAVSTDCDKVFVLNATGVGPVTYELPGVNSNSAFNTTEDGKITCNTTILDSNTLTSYILLVTATDSTTDALTATATVTVTLSTPPIIPAQYDASANVDWATQRDIYKDIYTKYYNDGTPLTDIVPVSDLANGALQVNMSMTLASLNGFDAVSGQIDISGSMLLEWEDEVVASELGTLWSTLGQGTSADVLVDYDKAWAPNIVLVNAVDTVKDIGDTSYKLRYYLVHSTTGSKTATVNWEPRILLRASCTPDVTFYPFDRQVCDFTYTAWGYLSGEITLSVTSSEWDTAAAEKNGVWKIISTESQTFTTDGSDYVRFRLTIQREPLYFTFNIALPILLLGLLNGFVFLLPAESGERIGFCITCFLSFVVLMQTTMGFLPEIASPMSLLCIYVFLMMCFSVFINITCILMSRIYQKPAKEKVPNWMKTVVRVVGCQVCRCLQKPPRDPYPEVEWPDVARMLDFFFFLSFLGSQASLTFFFLLPLATRY